MYHNQDMITINWALVAVVVSAMAVLGLIGGGFFFWRLHRRWSDFCQGLIQRGFSLPMGQEEGELDFSITILWQERRYITYRRQFIRYDPGIILRAAIADCSMYQDIRIRQSVFSCTFSDLKLPSLTVGPLHHIRGLLRWTEGSTTLSTGERQFDAVFSIFAPHGEDYSTVLTGRVREAMLALPGIILVSGKDSVMLYKDDAVLHGEPLGLALDLLDIVREEVCAPLKH